MTVIYRFCGVSVSLIWFWNMPAIWLTHVPDQISLNYNKVPNSSQKKLVTMFIKRHNSFITRLRYISTWLWNVNFELRNKLKSLQQPFFSRNKMSRGVLSSEKYSYTWNNSIDVYFGRISEPWIQIHIWHEWQFLYFCMSCRISLLRILKEVMSRLDPSIILCLINWKKYPKIYNVAFQFL